MRKNILMVEDDERVRRIMKMLLGNEKFNIDEVQDGGEALSMLEKGTYDLVILDLMLPHVDGLTVLKSIRSNPSTEELPVIIVSGKGQDKDILEGYKGKANYYITKPFEPEELIDSIGLILKV